MEESSCSYCREKLTVWNFDPDDVSTATSLWYWSPQRLSSIIPYGPRKTRAMIVFAQLGDIRVMQYILEQCSRKHGTAFARAELHQTDEFGLFPLYMAISEPHPEETVLNVCQWLYLRGANLQQTVAEEWSALSRACLKGYGNVALWLIQNGALLLKHTSCDEYKRPLFAYSLARRDLPSQGFYNGGVMGDKTLKQAQNAHKLIFAWANDTLATNEAFLWILRGTIPPKIEKDMADENTLRQAVKCRLAHFTDNACSHEALSFLLEEVSWDTLVSFYYKTLSPLRLLTGHPGILQQIAAFVGFTTDKTLLCTARGLLEHEVWWASSSLAEEQ